MNGIIRKLCEGYVGKARRKDEAREALLRLIDTSKGRGSGVELIRPEVCLLVQHISEKTGKLIMK